MYDGQMMPPIMGGSPGTVDKQVGASGDDGHRSNDDFYTAFVSMTVGYWTVGYTYELFARWTGVTIEGTIDISYIEVYAGAPTGTPERLIYGVDEDNPAAPTSKAEFDADALTTASVPWDGGWTNGAWNQSDSLNTIFQELVNSYTISNDAVMVQIKNDQTSIDGYQNCRTYDYSGNAHGAKLHIEYTVGNGGIPIFRRRIEGY